jgi:N-acetylmuramoyl-L-alanine amidase
VDKKVIIIDPGHGGEDRGYTGVSSSGEYFIEKDLNFEVAGFLMDWLKENKIKVKSTRNNDKFISAKDRRKLVLNCTDPLVISFHCEYNKDNFGRRGSEILFSNENIKTLRLASLFRQSLLGLADYPNLGARVDVTTKFFIESFEAPYVIVLLGQLSNISDVNFLSSKDNQKKLSELLGKSILSFYREMKWL